MIVVRGFIGAVHWSLGNCYRLTAAIDANRMQRSRKRYRT